MDDDIAIRIVAVTLSKRDAIVSISELDGTILASTYFDDVDHIETKLLFTILEYGVRILFNYEYEEKNMSKIKHIEDYIRCLRAYQFAKSPASVELINKQLAGILKRGTKLTFEVKNRINSIDLAGYSGTNIQNEKYNMDVVYRRGRFGSKYYGPTWKSHRL